MPSRGARALARASPCRMPSATATVFTTTIGTPIDARNLTRAFTALLARAGLPRIRFHDLRHSAATILLAQGVSPRVVMDLLGHSTIGMTLGTYSHVLPAMQRDAADQMDAALASSP